MAGGGDQTKPISLFYSYSHRDEELRDRLEEHLGGLRRRGLIEHWHDRRISAGTEWKDAIDDNLATADIILLLISSSFINSDYCWDKELRKALERHAMGEARVIPVLLKPCYWQGSLFAKLQMVPRDAKPITSWSDPDEAFVQVVAAIHRAVNEIRQLHSQAKPQAEPVKPMVAAQPLVTGQPATEREAIGQASHASTAHASAAGPAERTPHPHPHPDSLPLPLAGEGGTRDSGRVRGVRALPDFAAFRDIDAPWCPEMVVLPKGEFLMGSPDSDKDAHDDEKPQHRVIIAYRFAIGRYPVTFAEYDQFCEMTKRPKSADGGWGRNRRPVINVSWQDAQAYCLWLSKETAQSYRLASEAEWEYACRAGSTTRYSCGDSIAEKDAYYAPSFLRSLIGAIRGTSDVDSYPPNPWGLYDMHGNVREWVEDVGPDSYERAPSDGSAWTDGEGANSSRRRVVRGGSWYTYPGECRSASRIGIPPGFRYIYFGFRLAQTLD